MTLLSKLRVLSRFSALTKVPVRHSGHGNQIPIQRGTYMWNQFKDNLHFYTLLAVVPLSMLSLYCYVFIGDAELTEIPEGYTPHYYEYFKNPISRWIAKNLLYDKSVDYETFVARVTEESEAVILRKLERELKAMMAEKADNKSWFYRPLWIEDNRHTMEWQNEEPFRFFGFEDTGDKNE